MYHYIVNTTICARSEFQHETKKIYQFTLIWNVSIIISSLGFKNMMTKHLTLFNDSIRQQNGIVHE
jgi:hypothetical protein